MVVIYVLQWNSDNECLQRAEKLPDFLILKIASFKTSNPDNVGINWPDHDHLSKTDIDSKILYL